MSSYQQTAVNGELLIELLKFYHNLDDYIITKFQDERIRIIAFYQLQIMLQTDQNPMKIL